MAKPKILIIGCGSVGMVQGYHLSSGADITYLVRPGRSPAFAPPKRLYDYKANALRTFHNYRVVESTDELLGEEFYFVFDTLDGHTARSEGGVATLSAVGNLIRDKRETFVVYDSVGLDIDDHYAKTMGIAKERLILGVSMLAHQPTKSISTPASADPGLIAQADMLYSHQPGNVGLMVFNTQKKLAKAIQEVYNKNGTLQVQLQPGFIASWGTLIAMLHLMSWKIDGYQDFDHLRNNRELWSLMLRAQKEILNLPRLGWTGWLLSWVLGSWATTKINKSLMDGALPLSYREFNAFHHGKKVAKQDIQVLKDIVAEGENHGRKMEALRSICHKVD